MTEEDGIFIYETVEIQTHLDENDYGNKTADVTISFKYWLDGPIGFSVSLVGILINLIAIFVLSRQRVQRTFHLLMIYLSCWDFMYLILSVICFALPVVSVTYRDNIFIHLLPYAIPLAQICLSGSCYSTIALTVERYIAVCAPFFRLRHNIKARFYILPILLFAPLYNMPRFFEFTTVNNTTYSCLDNATVGPHLMSDLNQNNLTLFSSLAPPNLGPGSELVATKDLGVDSAENDSGLVLLEDDFLSKPKHELREICLKWHKKIVIELIVTDFRVDPIYVSVYINYVNLVVNLLLPTAVLSVMNCLIYRALRQNQAQANQLRRSTGGGARNAMNTEEALRKRDIRLTRIAIVIVGIFITCHLPRFIPNVVEMFMKNLPEWFAVLISVNNLLQIVNSTVNYIIYFSHCYRRNDNASGSSNGGTARSEIEMESKALMCSQSIRNNSSNSKLKRQQTMV